MKKRKRLVGVLLAVTALIIMQLPGSEADAASSPASDFKMEGSTLVKYRGREKNVSIPDTVEVIAEGAFEENRNIELVVIPNSVKRIEPYAFWGCDHLDSIVLGRGLKAVDDYAFAGCRGLEQMVIPSNVKSIGVQSFGDCVNLRDISIPVETVSIHDTAFDGCRQLTFHCEEGSAGDLFAKKFYEKQEEYAEYEDVPGYGDTEGTPSPTATPGAEVTPEPQQSALPEPVPGNVLGSTKVVGNRAVLFMNGGSLNVYGFGQGPQASQAPETALPEQIPGRGIPKYTIVDGSVVADQAYYRNTGLEAVTLPAGIREIGQFSFARSTLAQIFVPEGVENICYGAFYHCDSLTALNLPDTVMNVEPKAFAYTAWVQNFMDHSTSLTGDFLISGGVLVAYRGTGSSVSIPEGVRVIAAEAFKGHEEITAVTMPESLTVIGEGAFEDCTGLKEILLNRGLLQIKDRAFFHCAADEVEVPASVTEVGLRAFEGIEADYALRGPKTVYETSATRLSNEVYRVLEEDKGGAGVTPLGTEGVSASLEGAARHYTLNVTESQDTSLMDAAYRRAFGSGLPLQSAVYDMEFTDSSKIPLTRLGRQALTVVLPLPDGLQGKEVKLYGLDRNGQLEELPSEAVKADGRDAVQFSTNFISSIALCPAGGSSQGN